MKKVLAVLFAFNLFFINPIALNQFTAHAQLSAPTPTGGSGRYGEDITNTNFLQTNFNIEGDVDGGDSGEGDGEGILSTIAGYVANVAFSITNTLAGAAFSLGLEGIGNAITSFGYSFGSNVASPEGLSATAAGAGLSAALGGVGGFLAGQVAGGLMQGNLGDRVGDVTNAVGSLTGGTDIPKSGAQDSSYIPNIPKSLGGLSNETEDYCEGNAVNYTINSDETYKKFMTQDYKPNWGNNDSFILKINVRSTDTTKGGQLVRMSYGDSLASRAFVRVAVSKAKCNFGSNTQWFGMPIGWQPGAADIARYKYADGTQATKYLGSNSSSATFSINDSRAGVFNLTTGTWYITFQYLDNCADRNLANPNRNTSCHKVVEWVGGVQTNNIVDTNDILKNSGNVVLNSVNTFSLKKSTTGYNDLGVAIPKDLTVDDIINPSIFSIIKSWVRSPATDVTDPIRDPQAQLVNSPAMVLVEGDTYNFGRAGTDNVLTGEGRGSFVSRENLTWSDLCSKAIVKPVSTENFEKDYNRQFKAGLEVYPVDIPSNPNYQGSFYAVGLATNDRNAIYSFISDTPCPGTATKSYRFTGGIGGSLGEISNTNYTGSQPGNVKVSPGRWYLTLLWGSGAIPAATSPNFQGYESRGVFVRLRNNLPTGNLDPSTINNVPAATSAGTRVGPWTLDEDIFCPSTLVDANAMYPTASSYGWKNIGNMFYNGNTVPTSCNVGKKYIHHILNNGATCYVYSCAVTQ